MNDEAKIQFFVNPTIAYRLLPIAYCLLPIACCLFPVAFSLLPVASNEPFPSNQT